MSGQISRAGYIFTGTRREHKRYKARTTWWSAAALVAVLTRCDIARGAFPDPARSAGAGKTQNMPFDATATRSRLLLKWCYAEPRHIHQFFRVTKILISDLLVILQVFRNLVGQKNIWNLALYGETTAVPSVIPPGVLGIYFWGLSDQQRKRSYFSNSHTLKKSILNF